VGPAHETDADNPDPHHRIHLYSQCPLARAGSWSLPVTGPQNAAPAFPPPGRKATKPVWETRAIRLPKNQAKKNLVRKSHRKNSTLQCKVPEAKGLPIWRRAIFGKPDLPFLLKKRILKQVLDFPMGAVLSF
jgi:hypothetical protein